MATVDPNVEPFTRLKPEEASQRLSKGEAVLVDVREQNEWDAGHAEGAVHLPLNKVFTNAADLPEGGELIFICQVGQRSALAAEYAAAIGRSNLYNIEGGTDAWRAAGLPMK